MIGRLGVGAAGKGVEVRNESRTTGRDLDPLTARLTKNRVVGGLVVRVRKMRPSRILIRQDWR